MCGNAQGRIIVALLALANIVGRKAADGGILGGTAGQEPVTALATGLDVCPPVPLQWTTSNFSSLHQQKNLLMSKSLPIFADAFSCKADMLGNSGPPEVPSTAGVVFFADFLHYSYLCRRKD